VKGRCALVAGRGPPNGPAGKLVYTGGGARPRAAPPRPRPRGAPPRVGAELLAADDDMSYPSVLACLSQRLKARTGLTSGSLPSQFQLI